ncbi:MAG: phosphotransferase [Candidatus Calescibacterium sp.]|nr:phosphotransferase [Candidatus Calescibacterium sp.]MDW8132572.1 phosphotransferase [Candidatus Calescibacterium sp.]
MKIVNSGSDRSFVIFKDRVILIDPNRESLERYIKVSDFLNKRRINVPKIYKVFPNFVIIRNLGKSLYSELKSGRKTDRWLESRYYKIINELVKFHSIPLKNVEIFSSFDLKVLTWEWRYFIENYLLNYLGVKNIDRWFLFSDIVINVCYNVYRSFSNLIHRDLQSTNVIFFRGVPYFIDFQGMMVGNFLYDLASLLEDPYINLPFYLKEKLLVSYFRNSGWDWSLFSVYRYYKIQRLVQVLGAFAFLSLHKNKDFFIVHLKNSEMVFRNIIEEIKKL